MRTSPFSFTIRWSGCAALVTCSRRVMPRSQSSRNFGARSRPAISLRRNHAAPRVSSGVDPSRVGWKYGTSHSHRYTWVLPSSSTWWNVPAIRGGGNWPISSVGLPQRGGPRVLADVGVAAGHPPRAVRPLLEQEPLLAVLVAGAQQQPGEPGLVLCGGGLAQVRQRRLSLDAGRRRCATASRMHDAGHAAAENGASSGMSPSSAASLHRSQAFGDSSRCLCVHPVVPVALDRRRVDRPRHLGPGDQFRPDAVVPQSGPGDLLEPVLPLGADEPGQRLRVLALGAEVRRRARDEALGGRVAEVPRLGPQGRENVAEDRRAPRR